MEARAGAYQKTHQIPVGWSLINQRDFGMDDSSWLSVQEDKILLSSVFYFIKLLSIEEIKNLL